MTATRPLIAVVDDDESVRESLPDLLRELGYAVVAFASAEDLLASRKLDDIQCLLLDVAMPGMSGPELQVELARQKRTIPIIFITSQIDESIRHTVLDRGAIDCLFKPFTENALLAALKRASQLS